MRVTIRPALAADKERVLAFTRNTWDWGDYLSEVWDDWLNDRHGELAVAEMDGQPVAVAMSCLLSSDEGWLQGLRVHPDYRRHGIAVQITTHQLDWLRRQGASVARLAVHITNNASQGLVTRLGFQRVASFALREQKAPAETAAQAVVLAEADVPGAWAWLTASPTWRAGAGLWANNWTWQRLTYDTFIAQARSGNVLGVRAGSGWGALAIALRDDEGQHIGYADGAGGALTELADALSRRAWRGKAQYNIAMLPAPELAAAFEQAGYRAEDGGSAMLIYEDDL